jgi:hypothetical protein
MKQKFTLFLLCVFLLMGLQVNAQSVFSKSFVSGHLSTQGIGLEYKFSPEPAYNVRIGASILPFKYSAIYSARDERTNLDLDVNLGNIHTMFDWHPFFEETNFAQKLVATVGAAYFWQAKGNAVVSYRGTYNYGDIEIPSDELGQLYGSVEWNKVAPYLGIGIENPLPTKNFNIGFAIGTYYMGSPDVTLTGTKYLSKNQSNEEQFRKNMSSYRFLPVVQINFNYAINIY